jgi:hypothetical protein
MKNLILKNGRTYANRGMKEVREVNKRIQDRLLQKVRVKEEKIKKLAALIA